MKYYIKTFGCQMNEHDSQILAGLLDQYPNENYEFTENIDEADLILVNTCCIRESAENKILGYLGSLKKYKTANPNVILVVCGCMAQESSAIERIKSERPILILYLVPLIYRNYRSILKIIARSKNLFMILLKHLV